ncbi:hypothetical protein [Caenispirillum salinarum]|nr:hypothetical protein [Caenispirillum salinarum]
MSRAFNFVWHEYPIFFPILAPLIVWVTVPLFFLDPFMHECGEKRAGLAGAILFCPDQSEWHEAAQDAGLVKRDGGAAGEGGVRSSEPENPPGAKNSETGTTVRDFALAAAEAQGRIQWVSAHMVLMFVCGATMIAAALMLHTVWQDRRGSTESTAGLLVVLVVGCAIPAGMEITRYVGSWAPESFMGVPSLREYILMNNIVRVYKVYLPVVHHRIELATLYHAVAGIFVSGAAAAQLLRCEAFESGRTRYYEDPDLLSRRIERIRWLILVASILMVAATVHVYYALMWPAHLIDNPDIVNDSARYMRAFGVNLTFIFGVVASILTVAATMPAALVLRLRAKAMAVHHLPHAPTAERKAWLETHHLEVGVLRRLGDVAAFAAPALAGWLTPMLSPLVFPVG